MSWKKLKEEREDTIKLPRLWEDKIWKIGKESKHNFGKRGDHRLGLNHWGKGNKKNTGEGSIEREDIESFRIILNDRKRSNVAAG